MNAGRQENEQLRLAEQNTNLMQAVSQYQAAQKDSAQRTKELSQALKSAVARRDVLHKAERHDVAVDDESGYIRPVLLIDDGAMGPGEGAPVRITPIGELDCPEGPDWTGCARLEWRRRRRYGRHVHAADVRSADAASLLAVSFAREEARESDC